MKTRPEIGDKVHYVPFSKDPDHYENGIVKSYHEDSQYVFVVYKCNEDWENYKDYTGVMTPVDMLGKNFKTKSKNEKS